MPNTSTPLTILRDPMDMHLPEGGPRLRALIQEAIDLAGKLRWQSREAENIAEDISGYLEDGLGILKLAAAQEAEGDDIAQVHGWAATVRRV